jgi:WD40 repeat protein
MKEFQPHKSEITHIIYSNKYDYLITCSNDLKVKFHKDNEAKDNNYKVIREMKLLPDKKKINTENRKINLIRIVFDEEKGILLSCFLMD